MVSSQELLCKGFGRCNSDEQRYIPHTYLDKLWRELENEITSIAFSSSIVFSTLVIDCQRSRKGRECKKVPTQKRSYSKGVEGGLVDRGSCLAVQIRGTWKGTFRIPQSAAGDQCLICGLGVAPYPQYAIKDFCLRRPPRWKSESLASLWAIGIAVCAPVC